MNPYYNPFFQPRRVFRAPRRKSAKSKKKGPSNGLRTKGTTITYNDRLLLQIPALTPTQLNPTLREVLGAQTSSAETWWSQFRVEKISFRIVKISGPTGNVVIDSFPNPDGQKPASSEELLREQGKRTKVYVPGKTGMLNLGHCMKPKYDATGSGNQYTNVNLLDVNALGFAVEWNGVCFQTDVACSVEIDQQVVVTWFGPH